MNWLIECKIRFFNLSYNGRNYLPVTHRNYYFNDRSPCIILWHARRDGKSKIKTKLGNLFKMCTKRFEVASNFSILWDTMSSSEQISHWKLRQFAIRNNKLFIRSNSIFRISWLRIFKTIADQSGTKTTINEKVRLILVNQKFVDGSGEQDWLHSLNQSSWKFRICCQIWWRGPDFYYSWLNLTISH